MTVFDAARADLHPCLGLSLIHIYIISFSDIIGLVEAAIEKEEVRKEFYLKERVYEYVMENIEKALNNLRCV